MQIPKSAQQKYQLKFVVTNTSVNWNLLAEGQPYFFLPAWMRKWMQFSVRSVSTASFSGKLGCWKRSFRSPVIPSGLVPGDGKVTAERQPRTRSRYPFSVQGLSCKSQGPVCNFLFYLGPDVNCFVFRFHFYCSFWVLGDPCFVQKKLVHCGKSNLRHLNDFFLLSSVKVST